MYRVVRLPNGQTRRISSAKVAQQLGRSKGAQTIHATGKAHRWTSETARAAVLKAWKNAPVNRRIGIRLGRPAKYRPPVDRRALRLKHSQTLSNGVVYITRLRAWFVVSGGTVRQIGERAALIRLGYLPNPRGFVPSVIDTYPGKSTGTAVAPPSGKERKL